MAIKIISVGGVKLRRCYRAALHVHRLTGEPTWFLLLDVILSYLLYGASDEDFLTMEFYRKNWREKRRWLTSRKNNRYLPSRIYTAEARETFDNKALFDKVFMHKMQHEVLVCCEHTEEEIIAFIKKYDEVIVKPANGACGMGIYKCHNTTEEIHNLLERIKQGDKLIIEQVIQQHSEMARLNPYSVNTIRVITMVDRTGQVHIINTLVKFGTSSKCVSNTLGGGLCCHVDPETGIIDSKGHTIKGERMFRHPVSEIVIPGYQIPLWEGVCDYAIQLAKVMPAARYIGWDIVILKDGYDVIEGNIHPGQDFQASEGIGRWREIRDMI